MDTAYLRPIADKAIVAGGLLCLALAAGAYMNNITQEASDSVLAAQFSSPINPINPINQKNQKNQKNPNGGDSLPPGEKPPPHPWSSSQREGIGLNTMTS